MSYQVEHRPLEVSEYQTLRKTTNWPPLEDSAAEKALQRDLLSVCITYDQRPVGIGRVIGDGAIYFYIQDVMVDPQHQGKGVGALIMDAIEAFLRANASKNAFVGLMAAEGVSEFYEKYGYSKRPDNRPGMFKLL